MGTCSDFECKCGYEAYGRWGFGMNPIYREQKICLAPALCRDCRELVNVNENAALPKCPKCNGLDVVLYDDPSLGQVRRQSVANVRFVRRGPEPSGKAELEDYIEGVDTTVYLCPKCNLFTLEKMGGGLRFLWGKSIKSLPSLAVFAFASKATPLPVVRNPPMVLNGCFDNSVKTSRNEHAGAGSIGSLPCSTSLECFKSIASSIINKSPN